jgi:hypothetical protein
MPQDIRWKQRFQNFDRAVTLLREPFERDVATLSNLEKEGTVQRFEFTVELKSCTSGSWSGRTHDAALPRAS